VTTTPLIRRSVPTDTFQTLVVSTRYCTAGVDKRVSEYAVRAYTRADSAVSYLNPARIAQTIHRRLLYDARLQP